MASESNFEKDYIVKYFVNDLSYRKAEPAIFNSGLMLIPSLVQKFVWENNEQVCKEIIKKEFDGNKESFFKSLIYELSEYMYGAYNIAIQLHPKRHSSFKFLNKYTFNLYLPFDKKENDKNIYTVMEQPVFKIKENDGHLTIKPDLGIFINGFMVSQIELKFQHRGQNASQDGRGKIINDYVETIKRCVVDVSKINKAIYDDEKEKCKLNKSALKYFHSPMHFLAMDYSESYVMRGFQKYFSDVEKIYLNNKTSDSEIKEEIKKSFLLDAVYKKELNADLDSKCKKVLFNLYAPNNLQNEILYYNFLGYDRVSVYKDGKKEVKNKNNTPILNFPRPNQKYGVEKTIAEIIKKYENENNPNYECERLAQKIKHLHISEEQKKAILDKRMSYKNNKDQYSMLLQYAAGFGKTYILCWLALMMKDLTDPKLNGSKDYLFGKILLISDRVDLRDQVDRAMRNMNIESSLFGEADTKEVLVKYLKEDTPRVIIVNIQKFPHINELLGDNGKELKDKRIAFIIDEIHRSNEGKQHHSMTNLFDEVMDLMENKNSSKKNLIIGLTATPTDENLARFGEYQSCLEDIKWMPFDTYTMREAIDDGFVLDPTKALIPCAIELQFVQEEGKKLASKKEIYEDTERIQEISKKISEILVTTTFKKIYGTGKAMLACYSIKAAKEYYYAIKNELANITKNSRFSNYEKAKVYLVYTGTQDENPAHKVCEMGSEKETISAFKSDKNAIMIVVDKLQTGFDEPKLHTLFLDKDVRDIAAVQTCCRINRICNNKEDCLIIDFSIDNENISNIKNAFEKYAGITVSTLNAYELKQRVEEEYKKIIKTDYYTKFFKEYCNDRTDINLSRQTHEYVLGLFKTETGRKLAINDCELFMDYFQKMGIINNVIGVDEKYRTEDLLLFLKDYINLTKEIQKGGSDSKTKESVDFFIESIGFIESDKLIIDEMKDNKVKDAKFKNAKDGEYDIIKLILERNAHEKDKEALIAEYKSKLNILFEKIIEYDTKHNNAWLITKLSNIEHSTDEELTAGFTKVYNGAIRRLKAQPDMATFLKDIELHPMFVKNDFIGYWLRKKI